MKRASIVVGISLIVTILSVLLISCSEQSPSYLEAYQSCIELTMEECREKNKGKIPPELNKQLAEAACKIIKTECEKNFDGPVCQSLLDKYRRK